MIDSMFQEGTDAALNDQITRPKPEPATSPAFNLLGLGAAPFRGIGGGVSKAIAFGAEIAGAFGQVAGAYDIGPNATPEQERQAEAARQKVLTQGIDYSNEAGDLFRARAADILPDPKTAHASEQVVAGLADFATRAIGYTVTLGPLGPAAMGGDAALEEADRLKQAGVDLPTRTKAGAVAGVLNATAVAVPLSGATALTRFGKGAAVGVGTIAGQSAAERAILRAAGYDKIADTFDPLDPVALAMGVVPGALGAKFGHAPIKPAAERPRALLDMGLTERQALRYDDVRLDSYAVQAAQREGIPPEILLAVKNAGEKSGPKATSPKGAQGVMQFMPETWREFGRGDPTDPMNSIDAAARYLRRLHDTYGDWDAAIAHYNGGGRQAAKVRSGQAPVPETAAYLERVRAYVGKTGEEHVAAAARAEPDLVPAARVRQTAQALEDTRLTPDTDMAGRDAHLSAVEMAGDQLGRGEPVEVAGLLRPAMRSIEEFPSFRDTSELMRFAQDYHAANGPHEVTLLHATRDMGGLLDAQRFDQSHAGTGFGVPDTQRGTVFLAADRPTAEGYLQTLLAAKARGADMPEPGIVAVRVRRGAGVANGVEVQVKPADILGIEPLREFPPAKVARVERTASAADQLRALRQPAERPPTRAEVKAAEAARPAPGEQHGKSAPPKEKGAAAPDSGSTGNASMARAADEAAALNPDMLVHLEGMDAPMKVGELLAKVQEEAKQDTLLGKLVEVAAACDLTA